MKHYMKKTLAVLLVLVLISISFSACTPNTNDTSDVSGETKQGNTDNNTGTFSGTLSLAFSQGDSKNPFFVSSFLNRQIMPLLFDGLVKLNETFQPDLFLAQTAVINDASVNVTLKSSAFSEGSAITASDVVYSFNLAKKSTTYGPQLKNFSSATVNGDQIIFKLSSKDPYAISCLDFPIVKNSTADKKDDLPIGSGRYIFEGSGNAASLKVNPKHTHSATPKLEKIKLVNLVDTTAYANSLQIGNTHFMLDDLTQGKFQRTSAQTVPVYLNNLVFLGINSNTAVLKEASMLQAIAAAIQREEIVTTAYQGHAVASSYPVNPAWYMLKESSLKQKGFEKNKSTAILDAQENEDKFKVNSSNIRTYQNKPITLKLIVNEGNAFRNEAASIIAAQLKAVGIQIDVSVLSFSAYQAALKQGAFDLYLGEIKLTNNMDLSAFFTSGGTASFGISQSSEASKAYKEMKDGQKSFTDFIQIFDASPAFIPLCFRNGIAAYDKIIKTQVVSLESDPFYNISDWTF